MFILKILKDNFTLKFTCIANLCFYITSSLFFQSVFYFIWEVWIQFLLTSLSPKKINNTLMYYKTTIYTTTINIHQNTKEETSRRGDTINSKIKAESLISVLVYSTNLTYLYVYMRQAHEHVLQYYSNINFYTNQSTFTRNHNLLTNLLPTQNENENKIIFL